MRKDIHRGMLCFTRLRAIGRHAVAAAMLVVATLPVSATASAETARADAGVWIDTWSASPQPLWGPEFAVPIEIPRALRNQTIRQIARVSLGGDRIRVELSNEYGDQPLVIGAAHVALAGENGAIAPGTDRALTFSGNPSITIPPGAPVWSDPVDLTVPDLGSVAVSLFLPEITPATTWHRDARQTAYISNEGDHTGAERFDPAQTITSWLFLSGLAVEAEQGDRAVVLFGDSITDGDGASLDANHRWPDILAERLIEADADVAVLNEGISGARVLRDRMGVNALARFDRDVLSHPLADTVVVMMGINDIGWPDMLLTPKGEPAPSAEDVIDGYEQLIARAHANGMRIIGATLTPFENTFEGTPFYGYYSEEKEAKRAAINEWIRTSGAFDGVIDFDALTRDPANPKHIQAQYDKGDHLHPNDAGYRAMGEAVDLKLLGVQQ